MVSHRSFVVKDSLRLAALVLDNERSVACGQSMRERPLSLFLENRGGRKIEITLTKGEMFMSLKNFKAYQMSVEFYHVCASMKLPRYLKDQLNRASSSISLNLAEGSAKFSKKDKVRFYQIAFGSLRECQAVLDLADKGFHKERQMADELWACLYRLCHSKS